MATHLYVGHDGMVIAGLTNQPGPRVHVAWTDELVNEWHNDFRNLRLPDDEGHAISEAGLKILVGSLRPGDIGDAQAVMAPGDEEGDEPPVGYKLGPRGMRFIRCSHPVFGFREFLRVWHFLDQDNGKIKLLGENLWIGQEHFVLTCREHDWIYFLKARQLGETTIAIAYDGWVMRFRTVNARVHLVARIGDDSKKDLLQPLKAGLQALPEEMRLAESESTTSSYILDAGHGDRRGAFAYPAKEPGRGKTCSHLHLEEWAAMMKTGPELPKSVWAAAQPTISKHGGTCHILTTGVGPAGFYADVWRRCEAGNGELFAAFIGASGSRPEYTPEWLEKRREEMADDAAFRREYPETSKDALSGAGDTFFTSYEIDHASEYARGLAQVGVPRERGQVRWRDKRTGKLRKRKYVKAWDTAGPGEASDKVVGTVLDVTEEVWDVVAQEVYQGESYPMTAKRIEWMDERWPGLNVIEDNAAGAAIRAFVNLPEDRVIGFTTTAQSKPKIVSELKFTLSAQTLKWNADECRDLDTEARYYKIKDESIEQDCVMSLAIAVHHGAEAALENTGRVLGVVRV